MPNNNISADALADFQAAGQANTPAGVAPDALKDFQNAGVEQASKKRWEGRQWLGKQIAQDFKNDPEAALGNPMETIKAAGMPGQYLENAIARTADTVLPGNKAGAQMSGSAPMELGDVLAARGAPEGVASTLGFAGGIALPGPQQLAGALQGATVGAGMNAARGAATKFMQSVGPSIMRKEPEAVQEMFARPGEVFTKENMQDAPKTAQGIANELSQRIIDVKKSAKSLYTKAAKSASDNVLNPQMAESTAASMREHLGNEFDQGHIDDILGTTAWKEPASSNTYTQTHSYVPGTQLVDENGRALTLPGQQEIKGVVGTKQGGNFEKEVQVHGIDASGQPYLKGVQTIKGTSDKNPMQSVTVEEALRRMEDGTPVTVKQAAGLRTALQNKGTTTAGRMSDEALNLLAAHDQNFAKAQQGWSDYRTLEDSVAKPLFGGIKERYNSNIPADEQVIGKNGESLINYFSHPQGSEAADAPALADRILGQYGSGGNFESRIRAVAAGSGMHEKFPQGKFAVGSLLSEAAPHLIGKVLPSTEGMLEHPVAQKLFGGAAATVLALSSRALSKNVIRALAAKGQLPSGFEKALDSPAGKFLANSYQPASMATFGGYKAAENPQNTDENQAQ